MEVTRSSSGGRSWNRSGWTYQNSEKEWCLLFMIPADSTAEEGGRALQITPNLCRPSARSSGSGSSLLRAGWWRLPPAATRTANVSPRAAFNRNHKHFCVSDTVRSLDVVELPGFLDDSLIKKSRRNIRKCIRTEAENNTKSISVRATPQSHYHSTKLSFFNIDLYWETHKWTMYLVWNHQETHIINQDAA